MSKIKTILFDFGGVLVDIDFPLTLDAICKTIRKDPMDEAFKKDYIDWYMQIEKGLIPAEKLLWNFQNIATGKMPQGREVRDAWNAMLLDFPLHRIELLKKLRKEYKVCLLSNTNEIHIDWVRRFVKKHFEIDDYEGDCFDQIFYSYELNAHKPNHDIYEKTLEQIDCDPSEILFIDDSAANVKAAQEAGIKAIQHDPQIEICDVIRGYLEE